MTVPHITKRWLTACLCLVLIAAVGCTMIQANPDSAEETTASEARTPAPPAATATVEAAVTTEAEEAFILRSSIWDQTNIGVCWDTEGFDTEKTWVRDSLVQTWEQESALRFVGWQQCDADSDGIRITVRDAGPHVKVLGRFLDGMLDGMVLNFTFQNWSRDFCTASEARRQFCIEAIGVHEFGHAIGFAHEQNRPDAPQWCQDEAQGTDGDWLVTVFDLDSIMNYCNPDWNNEGLLSELDIQAAHTLYGGPQEIVDGDDEAPTQRNNMHTCPEGLYIVGVHVNRNAFLCSNEFGTYQASQENVDGDDEAPTQRSNMHACPSGSAVTGIHVDNNWLTCAPVTAGIKSESVDGDDEAVTVRGNMHACPAGSLLLGIHVDNNDLLCGR
jgi:hypothetical protein